jgi:hypothetical protein
MVPVLPVCVAGVLISVAPTMSYDGSPMITYLYLACYYRHLSLRSFRICITAMSMASRRLDAVCVLCCCYHISLTRRPGVFSEKSSINSYLLITSRTIKQNPPSSCGVRPKANAGVLLSRSFSLSPTMFLFHIPVAFRSSFYLSCLLFLSLLLSQILTERTPVPHLATPLDKYKWHHTQGKAEEAQ